MVYVRTTWENAPSTATPIDAARLNNMEAGIVAANAQATLTSLGLVELATLAETNTGTDAQRVAAVNVMTQYVQDYVAANGGGGGGGGGGAVASVGNGTTQLTGAVNLSGLFAALTHVHSADNITSGLLSLARLPAGSIIMVDKSKAIYGAAGSWPTTRPTARTDVVMIWKGNTDPGVIALDGDEWEVVV